MYTNFKQGQLRSIGAKLLRHTFFYADSINLLICVGFSHEGGVYFFRRKYQVILGGVPLVLNQF